MKPAPRPSAEPSTCSEGLSPPLPREFGVEVNELNNVFSLIASYFLPSAPANTRSARLAQHGWQRGQWHGAARAVDGCGRSTSGWAASRKSAAGPTPPPPAAAPPAPEPSPTPAPAPVPDAEASSPVLSGCLPPIAGPTASFPVDAHDGCSSPLMPDLPPDACFRPSGSCAAHLPTRSSCSGAGALRPQLPLAESPCASNTGSPACSRRVSAVNGLTFTLARAGARPGTSASGSPAGLEWTARFSLSGVGEEDLFLSACVYPSSLLASPAPAGPAQVPAPRPSTPEQDQQPQRRPPPVQPQPQPQPQALEQPFPAQALPAPLLPAPSFPLAARPGPASLNRVAAAEQGPADSAASSRGGSWSGAVLAGGGGPDMVMPLPPSVPGCRTEDVCEMPRAWWWSAGAAAPSRPPSPVRPWDARPQGLPSSLMCPAAAPGGGPRRQPSSRLLVST
ncbi:hypothetical protein HYH03_009313 [Edaphochlamys debaryana]|uniref:Uncharacterized protein n=1 Tax=Edaphochlamys debaryana TaxID=47281 RepID=A0A835Y4I8_9CHLO|nr:hypothetical protein HYH03_009313 [Edaphochlamys debaryana]|eukprot:KAG2492365.1 hypothetical protein HYH03_009313 [Edaphochlamys debaryana]